MDAFIDLLLGLLKLFYPLLFGSMITFIYALIKQSWKWMLISGVLLLPDAWFFSWYPSFSFARLFPLIQFFISFWWFRKQKRRS